VARTKTFEMNYFNTYYFANIVHSVVMNPIGYVRNFDEFYQVGLTLPNKFSKDSSLHEFIRFIIDGIFEETLQKECLEIEEKKLLSDHSKIKPFWINRALEKFGFEHKSFQEWCTDNSHKIDHHEDAIHTYVYEFLYDDYQELLNKLSSEVFYILFMNREFLLEFNRIIAIHIEGLTVDDNDPNITQNLKRDGVLFRADIPQWVKDAVFFRDRGHCVFCKCDLTNLITRLKPKNFDHMVPLNLSGANDVSNIQLTCETCNLSKSGDLIETSNTYEHWYTN